MEGRSGDGRLVADFDPAQSRDPQGRWTAGGEQSNGSQPSTQQSTSASVEGQPAPSEQDGRRDGQFASALRVAVAPILALIQIYHSVHNLTRSLASLAASLPLGGSGEKPETPSDPDELQSSEKKPAATPATAGQTPDDVVRGFAGRKFWQKWQNQMKKRGCTADDIEESIANGQKFPAENKVNPGNTATRYVNPRTSRSVVIENETGKVIQLGGDGFGHD